MSDKDLGVLWTVCSNLETLLLSEGLDRFPQSFRDNLAKAFEVLRAEHARGADVLMGAASQEGK